MWLRLILDDMNEKRIILFDLSGVLVELGGMSDFVKWTGMKKEEIIPRWLKSSSARDLERGFINFDSFYSEFIDEWDASVTYQELFSAFELWVKRAMPGAIELLDELSGKYTLACLTNTNSVQWPIVQKTINANKYFKHQFVSNELGKVKPDPDIFQHVVKKLNVPKEHIVFFDDSEMNVKAAINEGIESFHVKSPEEARNVLKGMGLI